MPRHRTARPGVAGELTRAILDSLAARWRTTVATIERLSGVEATTIHLIGGGSAIPLLRRLCASACERPVLAGPAEATVVGNAVVQAVAAGVLGEWRRAVSSSSGRWGSISHA